MAPAKSLLFTLAILFLLSHALLNSSRAYDIGDDDGDLDEFEELLAIDEEEERHSAVGGTAHGRPSEAQMVSRAQKIVLELNNDNAKRVVEENELVLLLGYTPWCPRSAELMPHFAKAATLLHEMGSTVTMAKINAERHSKAAKLFGIMGYPTLLLFVNGTSQRYSGGLTGQEIVIWIRKRTSSPVIQVSSTKEAEEFSKKYLMYAVGFFENYQETEYQEFMKAASTETEVQFVATDDREVARILFPDLPPERNFLGLVKPEPEKFENFGGVFEEDTIVEFVQHNKFPLVTAMTEQNSGKIYSSPIKIQVFLIAEYDDFEDVELIVREVARMFKTKIMFVFVDSAEENLAGPFLTLYGLKPEKPVITAFDNRKGSKHFMESDLSKRTLVDFCSQLVDGSLAPFFKSEPIPEMQKGLIEKVVGKTFDASVLDSTENIFLEVYSEFCAECEALSKQIEKAARHFKGADNVRFARIDGSANEHPKLQVNNYPAILFYNAMDKSNPIKLSKKSSWKDMINFIEKIIGTYSISADSVADDKDEL